MEFTLWTRDEKITRLHCHAGPDSSIMYGPYRNCEQKRRAKYPSISLEGTSYFSPAVIFM